MLPIITSQYLSICSNNGIILSLGQVQDITSTLGLDNFFICLRRHC